MSKKENINVQKNSVILFLLKELREKKKKKKKPWNASENGGTAAFCSLQQIGAVSVSLDTAQIGL